MRKYNRIHIALPVLNELEYLPEVVRCLEDQSFQNFRLFVCVNQPDDWWDIREKKSICIDNRKSIAYLESITSFPVTIIDRSSRGQGWIGKKHGVGWARKTVMDVIDEEAFPDDIIISLDADTGFNSCYLGSVLHNFNEHAGAIGLSVPYYHRLTGNEAADRAILRYEIYMRHYAVNLWRIGSPYSYTALGSAMAVPVWAYRKIRGLTPMKSGEDFYFFQKLVKAGKLLHWNKEKVYPAARFSDRVYFGTGPAMIKGRAGDWYSYPIYNTLLFDEIQETCKLFPILFEGDVSTPMDDFLRNVFREEDIWGPIRKNASGENSFVKACHQKIDGLRILQYLKRKQQQSDNNDEYYMFDFLNKYFPEKLKSLNCSPASFSFATAGIGTLNNIRDLYVEIEENFQQKHT